LRATIAIGDDMPEIKDWVGGGHAAVARGATSAAADNV